MSDTATPALDAPELPLSDYRAMREGRSVERAAIADARTSEAPPAEKPPAADAVSGAESETANDTELEGSEEGEQQGQEKKPPAGKRGLVDEVIKLRRENRELKTRVPPPSQEQQTKQAPPVEPAKPQAAANDPEPDIKKYSDYDKFNRDLVRWEIRNAQREAAEAAEQRAQQDQARARVTTWQQRVNAAVDESPDFEAVAFNTTLPISQVMGDAIMGSELGPKVLYHLGSNPNEAERISKLAPIDQIREIGKLEVKLSSPSPAADAASDEEETTLPKQAVSKAPPPIPRPAGSGTKTVPSMRSLEGMSQSEYRALRESGKLR